MTKNYWQLFYHCVWSTKDRLPMISPEIRDAILRSIYSKCDEMGCRVYAVEAVADHVHLLVSVPPSITLSDVLMNIKGSASHLVNHTMSADMHFAWQQGFGILSVSDHEKARVIEYIRSQTDRHRSGNLWSNLERSEPLIND